MSTTLQITDIGRVARANGVTEARVLRAVGELHLVEHRINGKAFVNTDDEDKIRQHLTAKGK